MKRFIAFSCIALAFGAVTAFAKDPVPAKERRVVRLRDGQLLVDGDPVRRGYLGVRLVSLTSELRQHFGAPKDTGVLVSSVSDDSPAAKAGVRVGDVITAVDGKPAKSVISVERAIRGHKDGDRVQIDIVRDRATRSLIATVDEREARLMDLSYLEDLPAIIDGDLLREGAIKFRDAVNTPEFRARMAKLGDCTSVQTRLKDLEKRLADLEKKK